MIKNAKVGTRLGAGFAVVLVFSMLVAGLGIWRLKAVAGQTQQMMDVPLKTERLVSQWNTLLLIAIQRTTTVVKSRDTELEKFLAQEAAASSKDSAQTLAQVEKLLTSDEERRLLAAINTYRKQFLAVRDRIYAIKKEGDAQQVEQLYAQEYVPVAKATQEAMRALLDFEKTRIDEIGQQVQDVAHRSEQHILLLEILILLSGIAFAVVLTRSITRPVDVALQISQRVANGDLTHRGEIAGRDELGQLVVSLQGMSQQLHGIVDSVRHGADSIATASGEIASGNLDLSARTEEQAGALEETAASIEQLTSSVRTNSDNALRANQLVTNASTIAQDGGAVMSDLIATMNTINESSKKIVDIISVIDGIAFQTNILALNAAVEAARAGEQGRGFAVVATEVRALAQRSAAAAKEIKQLIGDSVDKVGAGSRLVEQAGSTMSQVVDSVRGAHALMQDISSASREQADGIVQVNQAVTQMDGVTQQNAALVEQAAAAAKSLEDQAGALKRAVGFFNLGPGMNALDAPSPAQRRVALA
ncbi:methyl-accepting chemotaxis protein [Herbaspirillum sp. alder98]|uniref:methyl-accepting chemotaxis protein n=1 Tax=Herbaspirillum sp. alder98 TaxID=2913096 RepID=UPI001CD86A67|nr:methyl-accepting chemotaxis protein [Herbaspirillum sp. alder98]MCA1327020.1 methyl-accepting chemotaxis protein [Herbaspirillum sp. alder98]